MHNGDIMPTVKPDADNCIKLVADALNWVAWYDDKQIIYAVCMKYYEEEGVIEPCTLINIWEYQ